MKLRRARQLNIKKTHVNGNNSTLLWTSDTTSIADIEPIVNLTPLIYLNFGAQMTTNNAESEIFYSWLSEEYHWNQKTFPSLNSQTYTASVTQNRKSWWRHHSQSNELTMTWKCVKFIKWNWTELLFSYN